MRPQSDLELMVTTSIRDSGGAAPIDLLAIDQDEADWFRARLRGRHGARFIGVLLGKPGDELSLLERHSPWGAQ